MRSFLQRHRDVEHEQIGRRTLDRRERLASVRGGSDRITLSGERVPEHPADRRIVVDDED
jgi:phage protein U